MRRLTAIAAAVLTATGVAALVPHAHAETVKPSPADAASASPMLAAMGRDFGLTPEQAGIRLSREQWAATTSAELKRQLGPAVAGSWLTNGGQTLNVAISDPAKAGIVLAAGAVPKTVTQSWATLQNVKKLLDAAKPPAGVVDWSIDPATNSVVVHAEQGTESSVRQWLETLVPSAAVRVATSAGRPHLTDADDLFGGDRITFHENIFNEGRCTIGFAVKDGIITAGHCGHVGTETSNSDRGVGKVNASDFNIEGDMAYIKTESRWNLANLVWTDGNNTAIVRGSAEALIGASVCRSGVTTGWHCGTILAKDRTVTYSTGETIGGLTNTSVCAEPGDSGGPFLAGDQAQGVTSGGSGDCKTGGETLFQPVNEILGRYNLQLF